MKTLFILAIILNTLFVRAAAGQSLTPFERPPGAPVSAGNDGIDHLVFGKLKELGIIPANPSSDPVFLRRVFLDVIGTLPTAEEARAFLEDKDPNKRSLLIDRLLERPEFADYWGMRWCDLLRVKAEFPVNLWPNAAQAYNRWIRTSIKEDMPYSRFAWELLTSNGSNFRAPPVNFYRAAGSKDPKAIAQAVALTFMGERAEKWPPEKLAGVSTFFSQIGFKPTGEWKEEIVYFDGIDHKNALKAPAVLPDGTKVQLSPDKDPRESFTEWLFSSRNSPFARNAVNRIWFWLMGRGIIQDPDDSRPDNPPSNPELLDYLARELVATTYDMKQIYRLILNSQTYQLSCIPVSIDSQADEQFAYYPLRRLDAEVLIDALNQLSGTTEEYYSMIPEPFTWIPEDTRSIALPDGSIGSSFLDLFGRSPRDTGLLMERNNRPSSAQRLHLLNSSHVQGKLTKSDRLKAIFRPGLSPAEMISEVYLTFLSRYPTTAELETLAEYNQAGGSDEARRRQTAFDLMWALTNSTEFLYRH